MMRQAKLCVVLLALGMGWYGLPDRGFCADYNQHEEFGVKKAGDTISFAVTPPGKVLTGEQVAPGDYPWSGGPAAWSWTIPPVDAGVHNGIFRGTYQPEGGGGPGKPHVYRWEADTKVVVSNAPPPPEQGWWDCTYISSGGWFSGVWFCGWGTNWMDVKRRSKDDWGWYSGTYSSVQGAPYSISYVTYYVPPVFLNWQYPMYADYSMGYEARNGKYYMGPFDTKVAHSTIVQARSVRYGSEFSSQGAIGPENVWVKIIDVTNSYAEWEVSAEYGSLSIPLDPPHEPWTDITNTLNGRGNTTETKYEWFVLKVEIKAEDGTGNPREYVDADTEVDSSYNTVSYNAVVTPSVSGAFSWSTTSSKITLTDASSQIVTVNAGANASASVGAEDLKVQFTPAGASSPMESTHSLTVVHCSYTAYADSDGMGHAWWQYKLSPSDAVSLVQPEYIQKWANIEVGYWPAVNPSPPDFEAPGLVASGSQPGHSPTGPYTSQHTWDIPFVLLDHGLTYCNTLNKFPGTYNLFGNNCCHKTIQGAGAVGVSIPSDKTTPQSLHDYLSGL